VAVCPLHSGVLGFFSQKPGIHETPNTALVFAVDITAFADFSPPSSELAMAKAENGPEPARNIPKTVKNAYFLPDLNIAIP
jgi:hypothetical protein